jgi:hypothetical protein
MALSVGDVDTDATGSEGEGPGGDDGLETGSNGSASTSGPEPDDGSTSGGVDDGDTAGPGEDDGSTGDSPVAELAELEIGGAPLVDLDLVVIGQASDVMLQVTNGGTGDATAITAESLPSPFSFAGGSYPGTGGTCGQVLEAGTSCQVAVRFAPVAPVRTTGVLSLSYDPGDGQTVAATRQLVGGGRTSNLLANPGAESGPTDWVIGAGSWTSACEVQRHSGTGCFSAAVATGEDVTYSALFQDVDIAAWAAPIDAGDVAFELRGWARSLSWEFGDEWRIRGAARDGGDHIGWVASSGWQETYAWTAVEEEGLLSEGTRVFRFSLNCRKPSGHTYCDAFFDDLELVLRPAE